MISLIHAENQRSPHFAATSSTFTFQISSLELASHRCATIPTT